jgi:hypothetical protein
MDAADHPGDYERLIEELRRDHLQNSEFELATSNSCRVQLSVQNELIRDRFKRFLNHHDRSTIDGGKSVGKAIKFRLEGERLQSNGAQHVSALRHLYKVRVNRSI